MMGEIFVVLVFGLFIGIAINFNKEDELRRQEQEFSHRYDVVKNGKKFS